jgi:hypothetical protein
MSKNINRCKKCDGFGIYQDYDGGRVHRVYCGCEAGKKFRERITKSFEENKE